MDHCLRIRSIYGELGSAMSPHRSRIFIQHEIKKEAMTVCLPEADGSPSGQSPEPTARLGLGPHRWYTLPCLWLRGVEDAKGNIHLEMRNCFSVNSLTILLTLEGKAQAAVTQSTKPPFLHFPEVKLAYFVKVLFTFPYPPCLLLLQFPWVSTSYPPSECFIENPN